MPYDSDTTFHGEYENINFVDVGSGPSLFKVVGIDFLKIDFPITGIANLKKTCVLPTVLHHQIVSMTYL